MESIEKQLIAERLENIRHKGDVMLERTIGLFWVTSLVLGVLYGTLMIGILLSLGLGIFFFIVKYAFKRIYLTRQLLVIIWGGHLLTFVLQAKGLPEIRNLFYVMISIMVIYQDARIIYIASFFGWTYLNVGYYLQDTGMIKPEQYLNRPLTYEFLLIQNITLISNALACGWLAYILRRRTIETLYQQLKQEQYLVFRQQNIDFATKITAGNLDADLDVAAENAVGEALLRMRESLKEAAEKEQQDKFINTGLAQMADILRSGADIPTLSYEIVSHIIRYLKANQGGVFILEDANNDPHLNLTACYAYERRKYTKKRVEIGEGMVGQAVQEGDKIFITDLPADYMHITSGLGKANPTCILIVPLKFNDKIEGVLELATFEPFQPFEVLFVEKLAESIASTISTTRTNERTRLLLDELKQQTEMLRSQEEEMRQNMEELSATQEEMNRRQQDLEEMQQQEVAKYKKLIRELEEKR